MMRMLLAILGLLPLLTYGQDCQLPFALKTLDTPRASFMHSAGGSLWSDGSNAYSKIDDPSLSTAPASVAFNAGLWLGAIDQEDNLIIRAAEYPLFHGKSSYAAGPITNDFPNTEVCSVFNRIWEVEKDEILNHQTDWADNQSIDQPVPDNIKLWPGRGNELFEATYGVPLPNMDLAPFFDRNGDGKYDAAAGDYPDIRNARVGHWWMFNDTGPDAPSAVGEPYFDVSVLAYSFDKSLDNTTYFYEYHITNRSQQDFEEARLSIWLDADLGCYTDDFVGCKPSENLAYVYNEDAIDGQIGTSCPPGIQSFDIAIPIFGIKVLDGTDQLDQDQNWIDNGMNSFILIYGTEWIPGSGSPGMPSEYWNYMNGRWQNGFPITTGGLGFDPLGNSTDTTLFAFPDDPNDPNGWSFCSSGLGEGDRRMVINSGPFPLAAGASQKFAFAALVTGAIPDYPCPSLDPLIEMADHAQEVYDNLLIAGNQPPPGHGSLMIFPNPTDDVLNISLEQGTIQRVQVYNANGKLLTPVIQKGQHLTMETNLLATGLYVLVIEDQNGTSYSQRFIKH